MTSLEKLIEQALHCFRSGDLERTHTLADKIIRRAPGDPTTRNLLGNLAMKTGRHQEAVDIFQSLENQFPDSAMVHYNLGIAHANLQQWATAERYLRESLAIGPDQAGAHSALCHVACQRSLLDEALINGLKAIELAPDAWQAHTNLANAYTALGDHKKGLAHNIRAASLVPENGTVQLNLAIAYLGNGEKKRARKHLHLAIKLDPTLCDAYRQLSRLTRYETVKHPDFTQLENMLTNKKLSAEDRSNLHFALGKMYQDCEAYAQAFQHFMAGNSIEHSIHQFSLSAFSGYVSKLIEVFTPERMTHLSLTGNPSRQPLFIIGMPRSGATLVEQILSSHPDVFGAGELAWFWSLQQSLPGYPNNMDDFSKNTRKGLSGKFLDFLGALSGQAPYSRIIDKCPGNFERIGLISTLFPNARFIHCQRNPLDACLSIFTLRFPGKIHYGYDLETLGGYYQQYLRLMEHWKSLIPDRIIDIPYEQLVRDQEGWSRKLIDFSGVKWNEDCLRFYETRRAINTASGLQVRRPVYTDSIGRWKHYDEFLTPLKKGLGC